MELSLKDRNALVCGSTQGIGRATAIELASLGANVTLLARDEAKLKDVAKSLPGEGEHGYLVADFTNAQAPAAAARKLVDSGKPFHILINNTGGPAGGPIADATEEQFIATFRMHIIASQLLAQVVIPAMKSAGFGRIVNIISTSVKAPIPGLGVSNTIRAAMASWAKTLAGELAPHGITVNNVLPGFTDTERLTTLFKGRAEKSGKPYDAVLADAIGSIPAGRLGKAEEIGAAAAFLCTPAAAYINGINLPVDGGRTPSL